MRRRPVKGRAAWNGMGAMGSFSIWHWMLFGAVALLLFGGRGKISDLMGDVAKGIKSFKKGLSDDEAKTEPEPMPKAIEHRDEKPMGDVAKGIKSFEKGLGDDEAKTKPEPAPKGI